MIFPNLLKFKGQKFARSRINDRASSFKIHTSKSTAGFTLVELLVAMSLFSIVSVFAVGAVITTGDLARVAQSKRTVIDTVHFALETMSRKIKVGTDYHCDVTSGTATLPQACVNGADSFGFLSSDAVNRVEFRRSTQADPFSVIKGKIQTRSCPSSGSCASTWVDLTSVDEVDIKQLIFFATSDVLPSDLKQPFVLILVEGEVTVKGQPTNFVLQTYLAQRVLES